MPKIVYDFSEYSPFTFGQSGFFTRQPTIGPTGGPGLALDGGGAHRRVTIPNASVARSSSFKLGAWFRPFRTGIQFTGCGFFFGATGSDTSSTGYQALFDLRPSGGTTARVVIRLNNGGEALGASATFACSGGEWFWAEVTWNERGNIVFSVFDAPNGTKLAEAAATDNTHVAGRIGLNAHETATVSDYTVWFADQTIGHWRFDGNGVDSTGLSGTATGTSPTYAAGRIGQALDVLGTAATTVSAGNQATRLLPSAEVTYAAWINARSFTHATGLVGRSMFQSYGLTMGINTNTGNRLSFTASASGVGQGNVAFSTLVANRWYHVAITLKGRRLRLYIDGSLDREVTLPFDFVPDPANGPFVFGTSPQGGWSTNFFDGRIDDVRIANYAMSTREIRALARAKTGHWKLDGRGGDVSGESRHATLTGTGTVAGSPIGFSASAHGTPSTVASFETGTIPLVDTPFSGAVTRTETAMFSVVLTLAATPNGAILTGSGGASVAFEGAAGDLVVRTALVGGQRTEHRFARASFPTGTPFTLRWEYGVGANLTIRVWVNDVLLKPTQIVSTTSGAFWS